jgi:protein involved in polysaccharide export with SLBB domain
MPDDIIMVANSPAVPKPEYYVGGEVTRVGVYALDGHKINLLQALISAGANPPDMLDKRVRITRTTDDGNRSESYTIKQLLKQPGGGMTLQAGDTLEVGAIDGNFAKDFPRSTSAPSTLPSR